MSTLSFSGRSLTQIPLEGALQEEGFLLVLPDKKYTGTSRGDGHFTIESEHSFWNSILWSSSADYDEEAEQRFYYFERELTDEQMKEEIEAGMVSLSEEEVRSKAAALEKKGYVVVLPYISASLKRKQKSPVSFESRVLYNLYDFDSSSSDRVEVVNKMRRYATSGFLDPHSSNLISLPKVQQLYISGQFQKSYPRLTYLDNVLLNALSDQEYVSYGAIVPSNLEMVIQLQITPGYRRYFESGRALPDLDEMLDKDLKELLANYNEYELWWKNAVFVSQLERKHGLPVTGDPVHFLEKYATKEESDVEIVNTLLREGIAFDTTRFEFNLEDVNFRACISPVSLGIALGMIEQNEALSNNDRLAYLALLLETGGYYRYKRVDSTIPDYVLEDAEPDSLAWRGYLTAVFRFGDERTIREAANKYNQFLDSFGEGELIELFMRRGLRFYNFAVTNFESLFHKRLTEVSNVILASALPHLRDVTTFDQFFTKERYAFLRQPEHAQSLLLSALAVSTEVLSYFLGKLQGVAVDKTALYEAAIALGDLTQLAQLASAYGPASLSLDYTSEKMSLGLFALLHDFGFELDRVQVVNYLCRAYRGVNSLVLLNLIGADFERVAQVSLSWGNPLLAIEAKLNSK